MSEAPSDIERRLCGLFLAFPRIIPNFATAVKFTAVISEILQQDMSREELGGHGKMLGFSSTNTKENRKGFRLHLLKNSGMIVDMMIIFKNFWKAQTQINVEPKKIVGWGFIIVLSVFVCLIAFNLIYPLYKMYWTRHHYVEYYIPDYDVYAKLTHHDGSVYVGLSNKRECLDYEAECPKDVDYFKMPFSDIISCNHAHIKKDCPDTIFVNGCSYNEKTLTIQSISSDEDAVWPYRDCDSLQSYHCFYVERLFPYKFKLRAIDNSIRIKQLSRRNM